MSPVATRAAAFWGGACPTPKHTVSYTGNYTISADANHGLGVGYRLRIDINDAQSQLGDILMEMRERFSILPEP